MSCGRSFITLDLARKLSAAGCEVSVVDSWPMHFCRFSRSVARSLLVPSPRFDPKGFNDKIIDTIIIQKIEFFIPMFQETIFVAHALQRYPESCQVLCPSFEAIYELENKWLFNRKVARLGLPVPESALIQGPKDFAQLDANRTYALKPCFTAAAQQLYKIRGNQPPMQIEFPSYNPWIAQRWLEGKKYCTYGVCMNGKVLAHGVYPVSFAIDESSCLTFEAIEHQGITRWVENFVAAERYTGQIAFDFIETEDGMLYPIECNPRGTSGLHLFHTSDRIERAFFGIQKETIYPRVGNTKQLVVGMCIYGWRGKQSLRKFFRKLLTTSDVVFHLSDPLPFFFLPLFFAIHWGISKKLGLNMLKAFLHDIQWDGNFNLLGGEDDRAKPVSMEKAS